MKAVVPRLRTSRVSPRVLSATAAAIRMTVSVAASVTELA
jgi:hypothetical protein